MEPVYIVFIYQPVSFQKLLKILQNGTLVTIALFWLALYIYIYIYIEEEDFEKYWHGWDCSQVKFQPCWKVRIFFQQNFKSPHHPIFIFVSPASIRIGFSTVVVCNFKKGWTFSCIFLMLWWISSKLGSQMQNGNLYLLIQSKVKYQGQMSFEVKFNNIRWPEHVGCC